MPASINSLLRRTAAAALTLSVSAGLPGCATFEFPRALPDPPNPLYYVSETSGIAVALHPITEQEELQRQFGSGYIPANVIPVYVVVENVRTQSSVLVSRQRAFLGPISHFGGTRSDDFPGEDPSGRRAGLIVPLAQRLQLEADSVVLPTQADVDTGLLVEPGSRNRNSSRPSPRPIVMRDTLESATLAPGESASGFIYFEIPPESAEVTQWVARIDVIDLVDGSGHTFQTNFATTPPPAAATP